MIFKQKSVLIIIALFAVGIVLGRLHQNARLAGNSSVAQKMTQAAMFPFDTAFSKGKPIAYSVERSFRPRRSIIAENKQLAKENEKLRRENAALRKTSHENRELKRILNLKEKTSGSLVAAEIISRTPSNWFDTALINVGSKGGVKKGDCVLDDKGLIGQISEVNTWNSQIIYLTDASSSIGAMVERSRVAGILQGQGTDYLILNYLHKDADIKKNDTVISSGMGGVIPKGIVIGKVTEIHRDPSAGTTIAHIKPAVKLDELEYVFVMREAQ